MTLAAPAPMLTVGWGIRGAHAWPFWLEGTASVGRVQAKIG